MNDLSKLSVDGLKIDRSFIAAMSPTGEGLEIVRMILALARNLGLNVVAEGVETAEQMEFLRRPRGSWPPGRTGGGPLCPALDVPRPACQTPPRAL